MKKRLISVLLTVLMVMSLFSGMSLSAYADNTTNANTIQYQMVNGDNVFMICQRLGINFYDCKTAIMKLNGITDGMWSSLPVGKVLTLPASNVDGIKIGSSGIGGTTVTTGSGASTSTAQISATVTDPVAYYLIPYTMSRGETVAGVCNQLGINFNAYSEQIKKINGITNWTKVNAGSQLLLPSAKAPAVGTSCYAVLAHKVVKDETAYSIANNKGVSFAGNKGLLQALNNTNNLNSINAGDNFYVPVATTIAPANATTSASGTGSGTATTTSSTSGSTSSSTTAAAAKTYKLTTNINSAAGTLQFYVNNKAVTEAPAGAKVTVVVETKGNKAVKSLTVKHLDGKADLLMTGDTFIMPSCDVRVDVEIESGHKITIESNYQGKAAANVGGVSVTSAAKGSAVMIVSTDPSYEVYQMSASYKKLLGSKTDLVITNNGFVMPDADVTVKLTMRPVQTYDFYVNTVGSGSFFLQVNGSNVNKAAKGAEVKIITKAMEGFAVTGMTVTKHSTGSAISVFNNTFTMPADDVDVTVTFGTTGNNIVFMPAANGTAIAEDPSNPGVAITEANTGETVQLTAMPASLEYELEKYDVVRNIDGYKVNVNNVGGKYQFVMPSGGVTITPHFRGKNIIQVGSKVYLGSAVANDASGATLVLKYDDQIVNVTSSKSLSMRNGTVIYLSHECEDKINFVRYRIYRVDLGVVDDELNNQANLYGYVEVPNYPISIHAGFSSGTIAIDQPIYSPAKSATISCVLGAGTANERTIQECKAGDTVTLVVDPAVGYHFDDANYMSKLVVTRKDNGAQLSLTPTTLKNGTQGYAFVMPNCGVNIQGYMSKDAYKLTLKTRDVAGNDLTGDGLWKIIVNGQHHSIENGATTVNVAYNDVITFDDTFAGQSGYKFYSINVDGTVYTKDFGSLSVKVKDMLAKDFTIIATLKPTTPEPKVYALDYTTPRNFADGNVRFVIADSIYAFDSDKYVESAHAGDTVGIVPSDPAVGYAIDAKHIVITDKDGNRINVTKTTIGGKEAYTFVMPAKGYGSIKVNFYPIPFDATIQVFDTKSGTDITSSGLAKLDFTGLDLTSVLSTTSMGKIPFGTNVEAHATQLALKSKWKIDSVSVTCLDSSIKTPTVSKMDPEGYKFKMPASAIKIKINMSGGTLPTTIEEVTLPTKTADASALSLSYFKNAAHTQVYGSTTAAPGDKLYVVADVPDGKTLESLVYTKNSDTSIVLATVDEDGGFTVPNEAAPKAIAEVSTKSFTVKIAVKNAPENYTLNVDGKDVTAGMTISPVDYGKSIIVKVTGDRKIYKVEGLKNWTNDTGDMSGKGDLKPADDVESGSTVTITVNFATNKYTIPSTPPFFNDAAATESAGTSVNENSAVYVKPSAANPDEYVEKVKIKGEELNAQADGVFGPYTVTEDVDSSDVVVTSAKKTVTVQFTFNGKPDGAVIEVNGDTSSDTVTGVTSSSNVIQVKLHEPGGYQFVLPSSPSKFTISNTSVTTPEFTIDMSAVENGETVTIELGFVIPDRTIPNQDGSTTPVPLEFYTESDLSASSKVSGTVKDGTDVYIVANVTGTEYASGLKIGSDTPLSPNANGSFGPYKVTKNLTDADFTVVTSPKLVSLAISVVDGSLNEASEFVSIDINGTTPVGTSVTGLKDGDVVNVTAIGSATVQLASSESTGVTASLEADNSAGHFTIATASLENGASLNATIVIQKP